jgi:hypothetical protein
MKNSHETYLQAMALVYDCFDIGASDGLAGSKFQDALIDFW